MKWPFGGWGMKLQKQPSTTLMTIRKVKSCSIDKLDTTWKGPFKGYTIEP
jgi:hypothetical protein